MPSLALVWADGGYTGRLLGYARAVLRIAVGIVAKPEGQRGFAVLPRRWVVERTFAWLVRCADSIATTNACPNTPKRWSSGP